MAKKNYPYIGIYVDEHDPNIIRADMLDDNCNIVKSTKAICNTHEEKFNFRKGCEIAFNRLFDDDYIHPSDEYNVKKAVFRVGDKVKVVNFGQHYTLYKGFVETYCPHYLNSFSKGDEYFNKNGAKGTIVYYHEQDANLREVLYLVCFDEKDVDGNLRYGLYNDMGIKKL